jgi:DNA-binding transcriptional LysR family regulator
VFLKSISHVLSPALDAGVAAFKSRHPNIELVLETGSGGRIVESLLSGDVAIGVGFDEEMRPELEHALLLRERQLLYCGPNHRLAGMVISDPADLQGEAFVVLSEGEPPVLREFREKHRLGRRIGGLADNMFEVAWLISLGIGVGHLPEPLAATMDPPLTPLLPAGMDPTLDIYLMWRPDLQSRAAMMLVETIIEQIERRRST